MKGRPVARAPAHLPPGHIGRGHGAVVAHHDRGVGADMLCFSSIQRRWRFGGPMFTSNLPAALRDRGMKQPVGKGGPAGWILGLGDRCGQDTTSADTCHIVYFATFATHVVGGGIGWT